MCVASPHEHGWTQSDLLCESGRALKSPQILELSGIGDKTLLEPLGIEMKLHLPGVGTNVQDHIRLAGLVLGTSICQIGPLTNKQLPPELRADNDIQTFDSLSDSAVLEKSFKL